MECTPLMGLIATKDRKKHIRIDFMSLQINGVRIFKKEREKSFDLSAGCFLICQSMKTINANGLESQSGSCRLSKISPNRKKIQSFLCWMWHACLLLSGEMRVLQHRACVASFLLMTVECWVC